MIIEHCVRTGGPRDPYLSPYRQTEVPEGTTKILVWTNDGYDGTEIHVNFVREDEA